MDVAYNQCLPLMFIVLKTLLRLELQIHPSTFVAYNNIIVSCNRCGIHSELMWLKSLALMHLLPLFSRPRTRTCQLEIVIKTSDSREIDWFSIRFRHSYMPSNYFMHEKGTFFISNYNVLSDPTHPIVSLNIYNNYTHTYA